MRTQRALRIAMGALTVLLCAAMCWAVTDLYRAGLARRVELGSSTEAIFTREGVSARLRILAPGLGLWTLGALILAALGGPGANTKAAPESERMAALLRAWSTETPDEARREERLRMGVRAGQAALCAGCAVWALWYLLDGSHFTSWELEGVMGALLRHALPPVGVALAAGMLAERIVEGSLRREIAALRRVPRAKERRAAPMRVPAQNRARVALRLVLIGAAAALIALGAGNGGLNDVLVKAINICTECIGLG